jgi:hypothetical protein
MLARAECKRKSSNDCASLPAVDKAHMSCKCNLRYLLTQQGILGDATAAAAAAL